MYRLQWFLYLLSLVRCSNIRQLLVNIIYIYVCLCVRVVSLAFRFEMHLDYETQETAYQLMIAQNNYLLFKYRNKNAHQTAEIYVILIYCNQVIKAGVHTSLGLYYILDCFPTILYIRLTLIDFPDEKTIIVFIARDIM